MNPALATGEQLAHALHVLGVDFIFDSASASSQALSQQPEQLIAALAESREARLRLSLIPLFLEHPEFSKEARAAAPGLRPAAQVTLQCYYTAAVLLQRIHRSQLENLLGRKPLLPDLFSQNLGFQTTADAEYDLHRLAEQHEILSGLNINWLGTYHHAFQVWRQGLELRKSKADG